MEEESPPAVVLGRKLVADTHLLLLLLVNTLLLWIQMPNGQEKVNYHGSQTMLTCQ